MWMSPECCFCLKPLLPSWPPISWPHVVPFRPPEVSGKNSHLQEDGRANLSPVTYPQVQKEDNEPRWNRARCIAGLVLCPQVTLGKTTGPHSFW